MPTISEADCISAIRAAMPRISPAWAPPRALGIGYAYQALVMTAAGTELLRRSPSWSWKHPLTTTVPTFAARSGLDLATAMRDFSFLESPEGNRVLVQEVRVAGRYGSEHAIDLSVCGVGNVPTLLTTTALIEVKNHGRSLSMDLARELVGLSHDLTRGKWSVAAKPVVLVSAQGMSSAAESLVATYYVVVRRNMDPMALTGAAARPFGGVVF